MPRTAKTARELEDLIRTRLGAKSVFIHVRPHSALGWRADVTSTPDDRTRVQKQVDQIASELRDHFDLR